MLLLLQRCMSLSLWVTCYCLCGLVTSFIFPPDSCCKHKDHLQKNNKLTSVKKPTDTCVCASFIYYMATRQKGNVSLCNVKQINVVCAMSRTARGGRRNSSSQARLCGRSFSPPLASLHTGNYWILLKGMLVMAFATDDNCLRPKHLHRLMFSQTERLDRRYCNNTDVFSSNQAALRRWLGEQG